MNRKISLDDLHKVEASSAIPLAQNASNIVEAIIKVKIPGYVPKSVRVRASISPHILTCELRQGDLASLENDSNVESVSVGKKLKSTG